MDAGWKRSLPVIGGEPDAAYLAAALARVGRPHRTGAVAVERATGGRQSIPVLMLRSEHAGAYALKTIPESSWRTDFAGGTAPEPTFWANGLTRTLPPPLACPTIELAFHEPRREYWMLMDDVGAGMLGLADHDPGRLRRLLGGLARLHARFWDRTGDLAGLPLLSIGQRAAIACEPILALAGRREPAGWIAGALDNFVLMRPLVPLFLDFLQPGERGFYLSLLEDRAPIIARLVAGPQALVHGDVWHANLALPSGRVVLFDWDLATAGPGAFDLAWYWVLHFWCYPPADGIAPAGRAAFLAHYADEMAALLGARFERGAFDEAFDLCWLIAFSQLACTLTGSLTLADTPEERRRCRSAVEAAFAEARRLMALRLG